MNVANEAFCTAGGIHTRSSDDCNSSVVLCGRRVSQVFIALRLMEKSSYERPASRLAVATVLKSLHIQDYVSDLHAVFTVW